jgi:hypothetical protein
MWKTTDLHKKNLQIFEAFSKFNQNTRIKMVSYSCKLKIFALKVNLCYGQFFIDDEKLQSSVKMHNFTSFKN